MNWNLIGILLVLLLVIIWNYKSMHKEHFYWYYPPSANCMENVFGNLQCAKYPWWFYGSYYPYFPISSPKLIKYDSLGRPISFPSSNIKIRKIG